MVPDHQDQPNTQRVTIQKPITVSSIDSRSRKNLLAISGEEQTPHLPNLMVTNHNTGSLNISTLPDNFVSGENLDEYNSAIMLKEKSEDMSNTIGRKIYRNKRY